jgi:hypothetical protein
MLAFNADALNLNFINIDFHKPGRMQKVEKDNILRFITSLFIFLFPLLANAQPEPPAFSTKHGFFYSPFNLSISSPTQGCSIYYTLDGSVPDQITGILYNVPLEITTTTVIRAVCMKTGMTVSKTTTATYLFPDSIIRQPNNPDGYPAQWGPFLSISGTAPADYEMDPELMADPVFANSVKEALKSLPVISLVTDKDHLFLNSTDPETGGIYIHTGTLEGLGYGWQRPVSFEFFDSRDSVSFQADCGIEIQGGEGRRPEKSPKHSFRLVFRSEYGPKKLIFPVFGADAAAVHNNIILRSGFNNTWIHWTGIERSRAQYQRDRWTKDTQLAMGHYASHGIYVHLFINGLYWGIYNPSERMDREFAELYFGGNEDDYDVMKDYAEAVDGSSTMWTAAMTMANAGLSGNVSYHRLLGNNPDGTRNPLYPPMVDPVSLADYMILNFYGSNWDWDHHNWVAIRNRVNPGKGFQFFAWDSERIVEGVNSNILNENNDKCPSRLFQMMRQNEEFRRLFAGRVQKHCYNNGVLTPESAATRWMMRGVLLGKAIDAESARWGDYRRDVHRWQTAGPFPLYTKNDHWLPQQAYLMNTYFPERTAIFINHLRLAGLFPNVEAPTFLINGNPVFQSRIISGAALSMSAPSGTIYYTTDGSDPVNWLNIPSVSSSAIQYTGPMILNGSSLVRARVLSGGEWSASAEYYFLIGSDIPALKITEINYHPEEEVEGAGKELEFIELKNTGPNMLDLGKMKIAGGINYNFPEETYLGPKSFIVLASNMKNFYAHYAFVPSGEFNGQLDNKCDTIILLSASSDTLLSVIYSDGEGWPEEADGEGKSIVPVDLNPAGQQNSPELWRASCNNGGSPGRDDLYILLSGTKAIMATIFQNYPNPFRETTKLPYELHEDAHVKLLVIDISGKLVTVLEDEFKQAGYYETEWNGANSVNAAADNGLYFYRLIVSGSKGTDFLTRKVLLLR